jgi:hypothetical protein
MMVLSWLRNREVRLRLLRDEQDLAAQHDASAFDNHQPAGNAPIRTIECSVAKRERCSVRGRQWETDA